MARILLLLAVVLGIVWWLRARASAHQAAKQKQREPAPAHGEDAIEPMVQCAHCGVHLPRGEAIAWRGLHYCRRSHLPDTAGEDGA